MALKDRYVSRREAQRELGLTRDQMLYRLSTGDIKSEKVDWLYMIPASEIERVKQSDWYKGTTFRQIPVK